MLTRIAIALSVVLSMVAAGERPASAGPTPVLDAHVQMGVASDTTVIPRLHAGGLLVFDDIRVALEAHVSFAGFLRVSDDQGISAKAVTPLNLGVRYGFRDKFFTGPYATLNWGWSFFSGEPRDRRVKDEVELCATATTEVPGSCAFEIKQNINTRLGVGWGFRSGKKITVGVKFEVAHYLFNVVDGEEQPAGAPNPNFIDRPQSAIALMLGLEFMRWR